MLIVIAFPYFFSGTSFGESGMPSASMGAPQFLSDSVVLETFIVKDYGLLNRFGMGVSKGGVGVFWYVVNVEDEYMNTISVGANLGVFSADASFGSEFHAGVGFMRKFMEFDVCGYAGLIGRRFGYACVFSTGSKAFGGIELFLEEGFPLDYRFFARYEIAEGIFVSVSYSTLRRSFITGFSYRFFTIGYGEHELLGSSYYYRMIYGR